MRRLKFLILFSWTLLLLAAAWWRYPVPMQGAPELARSLAVTAVLLLTALALGRALLQPFHLFHGSLLQEGGYSLGLGLGLLSLLVSGLGALGGLFPWVAWMLVAGLLAALWHHLEELASMLALALRAKHPWEGSSTEIATLLALGLAAASVCLLALAPPSFYDAMVYHLAQAQRAALSGTAEPQAGVLFTWLPSLAEPLWTLALLLDGETAATALAPSLLNLALGLALGLMLMDAAARLMHDRRLWLTPALAMTQPLLALTFGVFSPDGWAAFYAFLSFNAFLLALDERVMRSQKGWLLLSALLAGGAVAAKPVALLHAGALLLMLAGLAVADRTWRRPGLLLAGAGLFLLPLLPWLLRGALLKGQPFYPFPVRLMGWTLSAGAGPAYYEHLQSFGGEGWMAWLRLPFAVFFDPGSLGGNGHPGILLLALIPAIAVSKLERPLRWTGLYLLLGSGLWLLGPHVLRYGVFLIAPASLLAAHGVIEAEAWAVSRTWTYLWRGLILTALISGALQVLAIVEKDFDPLAVVLGRESSQDYLSRRGVPQARAAAWMAAQGAVAPRVLVLGDARTAYLGPGAQASSVFEASPVETWTKRCKSPEQIGVTARLKGYDFVYFNAAEWDRTQRGGGSVSRYWPVGDETARQRFFAWIDLLRALPPDKRLSEGPLLVARLR